MENCVENMHIYILKDLIWLTLLKVFSFILRNGSGCVQHFRGTKLFTFYFSLHDFSFIHCYSWKASWMS